MGTCVRYMRSQSHWLSRLVAKVRTFWTLIESGLLQQPSCVSISGNLVKVQILMHKAFLLVLRREVRQTPQIRGQSGISEVKRFANECKTQKLPLANPHLECLGRRLEEESAISPLGRKSF